MKHWWKEFESEINKTQEAILIWTRLFFQGVCFFWGGSTKTKIGGWFRSVGELEVLELRFAFFRPLTESYGMTSGMTFSRTSSYMNGSVFVWSTVYMYMG